jgi:hypothetical protein
MKRDFLLPENDQAFVDALKFGLETIIDGSQWLCIHNYPVPAGYNIKEVCVALMIPPGYPTTQLDMAYFFPPLIRQDGRPIAALASQAINGKTFQRWSRHRTGENPWRPGVDDISTHLSMVTSWFERELKK